MIHELNERGQLLDTMFREICQNDHDALLTCWSIYQFAHVLDDLIDRDHPVSADQAGLATIGLLETAAVNPFFQRHRDSLLGALKVATHEWMDSEAWKLREGARARMAAEVLKSQYQNVFFLVADHVGGLNHMRAMSAKWRDYQFDSLLDSTLEVPKA